MIKNLISSRGKYSPDLTGSWKSLVQSCKQSRTKLRCSLNGTFRVQNQGTGRVSKSKLKFYRSGGATLDESDSLLERMDVGALKAGEKQKQTLLVKLPAGSSASGQYILAVVDANDVLEENDETNNTIVFGPLPLLP